MRFTTLTLAVALSASQALASGPGPEHAGECTMTYGAFEASVPHIDLSECPNSVLPGENVFCRASIANEELQVFVFDYEGAQCLRAHMSYAEEDFTISVR